MARTSTARPPRPRLRLFLVLLITAIVFGGVFAAKAIMGRGMNDFFDNMPQPAVAITAFEAEQASWETPLEAVGTLVAVNGTDVTTEAGGVVRRLSFEAGQPVKAGTVLVELNTDNELAVLRASEAAAKLAAVQRDRWQELGRDQLVSQAEVEERATQAATSLAEVEAQRALIAQKTIRAPFDGVLGIRKVNLGQYVSPGSAIVSLQSLDPIYLDFSLPEQQLPLVREGATVQAGVDALPGERFEGTITAIEPSVDPATRNFQVQATLANPDGKLRPGAFARVGLSVGGPQEVVVIPQTAVTFNPYGNAVYVVSERPADPDAPAAEGDADDGPTLVVRQRFIQTGATRGDLIAVTDGLKPGERVATSGLLKLRNDATVTINNRVQPAADAAPRPENR
ncbi:efflux RND transporter periplasmic adaptor subunit [Luteimonas sp. BDR2-5]|uniref:efflux RND transporter periplasmic adaptor subunit n=1 Tax=Proluteimonas luteida TaxID=2878685 RepID=UPI001E4B31A9|nr:efflux RND transporter periplasmic adaptor subunit [Luteimonas sp. BDR2-5]MCD9028433.1 efflux RND transporter periplasmic adaptor subunit [Luteimonas sp. BDR2-5]